MVEDKSTRLSRRAAIAAWGCRAVAVAIPTILLASWGFGEAQSTALTQLGLPPDHSLSPVQRLGGIALSLLPTLAVGASLFSLARCFDGFARGDWFDAVQPRALAWAGRWQILAGVLTLVVPTLLGLVLSLNAAPGDRVLAITLSSNGFLAILFGVAFWSLGLLWENARAIAAENDTFV